MARLSLRSTDICERRPNARCVTDAIHKRQADGTFSRRSIDDVGVPGILRAERGEGNVEQEEREVAWPETLREHEDEAPHHANGDGVDVEPEAVLEFVGEERVAEGVDHYEEVSMLKSVCAEAGDLDG